MPPDAPIDGNRLQFVLSAGRTGTTFLAHVAPVVLPSLTIRQEPPGSRPMFMALNAATVGVIGQGWLERIYFASRRRWLDQGRPDERFVEINPFTVPLAAKFGGMIRPLRAVHMVRDPRDWIQSMGSFKAFGWRRHIIDYVPFAQSIHPAVRRDWLRLDPIRRLAWRWRLANEQIDACRADCERYELVHYEQLFSADPDARVAAMKTIVDVLAPGSRPDYAAIPWSDTINPAGRTIVPAWQGWDDALKRDVAAILGPQMARYGYEGGAGWPSP
jgi:hypothetical protein